MLILTRKIDECITIGDRIRVHVLAIKGKQVRLGIEAPTDAIVHREEIYQRIIDENRMAARVGIHSLNHHQKVQGVTSNLEDTNESSRND